MLIFAKLVIFFSMLIQGEILECESDLLGWANSFLSPTETNYTKMIEYSGRFLNELGLYFPCQELSNAEYVIFEFYEVPAVVIGLCLPISCSIDDYWSIIESRSSSPFSQFFSALQQPVSSYGLSRKVQVSALSQRKLRDTQISRIVFPKDHVAGIKDFTASAALMLSLMILLLLMALIGTIVEFTIFSINSTTTSSGSSSENTSINLIFIDNKGPKLNKFAKNSKTVQFFLCFSLYSNFHKLFAVKDEKKKDPIDCLNAIRVFSICWVVLGQTNLFRQKNSVILNLDDTRSSFNSTSYMIVSNSTFAIDTFFWISGFTQGYLMTMQLIKAKKVNWLMIVVHRILRILPLYMFVFFSSWTLARYIGNGPKWYNANYIMHQDCDQYFWTYPLFINNFVLPQTTNNCLVGSWYLPNDMQFFLISLPIMYLYIKHSRVFGWGLLSMCIVFSVIAAGTISYDEHLHVKLDDPEDSHNLNDDLYYKPYIRITPFCVGLLGGFIFHEHSRKSSKNEFDSLAAWVASLYNGSRIVRFVSYALGVFCINFFIFVTSSSYDSNNHWSRNENSAYFAFQRLGWALGLHFFFLPVLLGHLSFFRPFLQSNWWAVLAKLVFSVYLLHMVVGQIYFFSQPVTFFWHKFTLFIDSCFILATSFALAIPVTLIVEMPLIGLERLLLGN